MNPHYKLTTRDAMLDQINTAIGASGLLRIYDGAQPTNADTALGAQNVVAELALSATALGAAASGVATANAISDDTSAAGGTAAWFSLLTSAGVRIADGSVGTSGADLNLNSTAITLGANVSVSALTLTLAA
jgi:hypothetical protein